MKKSDSAYVGASCFAAFFALFYMCTAYFKIPLPKYYPLDHVWSIAIRQGAISQGWYGMLGFAFICAAILCLFIYFLIRHIGTEKSALTPVMTKLTGILATLIVAGTIVWFAFHEFSKI